MGNPRITTGPPQSIWTAHTSLRRQLKLLSQEIDRLNSAVAEVSNTLDQEVTDRQQAIECLRQETESAINALRDQIRQQERLSAELDAHGLPVLALSIALTAVPDLLVTSGWIVTICTLLIAYAFSVRQTTIALRKARSSPPPSPAT